MGFIVDQTDNIVDTLANSANFLAWCGAATAAAAKISNIFAYNATDDAGKSDRFAVVADIDPWSFEKDSEGGGVGVGGYTQSLTCEILFFESLEGDSQKFTEASARAFLEAIPDICIDILNSAGSRGVRISSLSKVPYDDQFKMRTIEGPDGNAGYQYRVVIQTRT